MSIIAIVTGANRGIGLEVCHQLAQQGVTVVLGSRDLAKGQQAVQPYIQQGLLIDVQQLDVTDNQSIERLRQYIDITYHRVDVLVNNAAILYDTWQHAVDADLQVVKQALDTNIFGAWRMCQAFIPLLHKSSHGRIVNVSSEAGSLTTMGEGTPAYNVSKTALNALTRMLSAELHSAGILVNSICPGWVATEMGGAGGRPVQEGAAGIIWAALLPDDGPTGGFFRDGKPLAW